MGIIRKIGKKARRGLLNNFQDIRSQLGLNERFYREARGSRIIIYHGLCLKDHTRFNSIFLKAATFENHLRFYKKYFNVVSLDDYYAGRFDPDKFNVCLSFDDGFANNYKYVLPLIEKYELPCTFFITGIRNAGFDILWNDFLCQLQAYGPSDFNFLDKEYYRNDDQVYVARSDNQSLKDISRAANFSWKASLMELLRDHWPAQTKKKEEDFWLQMTMEEIKLLSASKFSTIGAHGYSHDDLANLPVATAKQELSRSKQFLEELIQKEVDAIAFPYGSYSREVTAIAKEIGFDKLLAMDFIYEEDKEDEKMRERFTVNPYISVNNQMRAIIQRKYY